ncbi:hypothetical protein DPEC_G00025500 [Dallia pectoralis]|uniref:Uncharacterized protein n=1 Tax=Dallia pectoralis TaxID=75939 RepID=A0ACC2HHE3_DALPE|nr:hypothetical protein DPEC_G00025500 [Dallia pectoralis]
MATTTQENSSLPTQQELEILRPEPILAQLGQDQPDQEPIPVCCLEPSPVPDQNQGQNPPHSLSWSSAHHNREEEDDEDGPDANSRPGQETAGGEQSDPDWVEERFRIDRKKLESMLYDPHVKVEGKKVNVLEAKKQILRFLETKVNKVTLKMDVAHTEHSHVIGKGGGNIKKVMEMTSCHIHFPDSNRHNAIGEKSNQVSIAGPVQGVEAARKGIRDLQPLVLSFDLPMTLSHQALPDAASPVIQQVAQSLGVTVNFRAQPRLYSSCCVVRGLQGNAIAVKKAVCVLMKLLLGSEVGVVAGGQGGITGVVSTQLDVTSQQHLFLLGQNGAHFLGVMHQTQTQIVLPDLSAPQNPPSLLIQGSPDGVCLARQQLMDCLPLCLMFDMREDDEADPRHLSQMMRSLGIFISVKPKLKQTAKSVVVKGLERNISSLYEARRLLLGLDSVEVAGATNMNPDSTLVGSELTNYWLNMLLQQLRLSDHGLTPPNEEVRMGIKGTESRQLEKIPENEDPSSMSEEEEGPSLMTSELRDVMTQVRMMGRRSSLQGPEVCRFLNQGRRHSTGQAMTMRLLNGEMEGGCSDRQNSLREMEGGCSDRRNSLREMEGGGSDRRNSLREMERGCCDRRNSLREMKGERSGTRRNSLRREVTQDSLSDGSKNEDYDYEMKKLLATRAMQRKPVVTEVQTPTDTWSGLGFSKSMPAEAVKELRNVSRRSYKPYLANTGQQQQTRGLPNGMENIGNGSNSENWRDRRGSLSSSFNITPSPSSSSSSSPSNFSLSSSTSSFPAFTSSTNRSQTVQASESFNYFEGVSTAQRSPSPQATANLDELLSQLGLGKYIDVFEQQEIDFQTFLTLSDEDLKEVGLSTFGARRKMLMAISDLNKSKRKQSEMSAVKPGYQPEMSAVKPGYLEGGASGRLPRMMDEDSAAQSNH